MLTFCENYLNPSTREISNPFSCSLKTLLPNTLTAPAPIIAFSPIVTPGNIVAFAPILAPFLMIALENSLGYCLDLGYLSLQKVTLGPIKHHSL